MPETATIGPSRIALLERGELRYFTQRVTAPPLADCMFAAVCTPLTFMGYDIPDSFIADLRRESGVPTTDKDGHGQGTSSADTRRALLVLLPGAPIRFEGLDDQDMLNRLESGEITVRVVVKMGPALPGHVRRWVGKTWVGKHAVAIGNARHAADGSWEVLWMDPAGRRGKGYSGEWLPYGIVAGSLARTKTKQVAVTFGERDSALGTTKKNGPGPEPEGEASVKVLTGARADEFARIPKGTPFLHPETLERVTSAVTDDDYRLCGHSLDGKFTGVLVMTKRIEGASGYTLLLADSASIGAPFIQAGAP